MKYRCRDVDGCSGSRDINAPNAEYAAEMFMEKNWADADFPDEMTVEVSIDGIVTMYTVTAQPTIEFSAHEVEE